MFQPWCGIFGRNEGAPLPIVHGAGWSSKLTLPSSFLPLSVAMQSSLPCPGPHLAFLAQYLCPCCPATWRQTVVQVHSLSPGCRDLNPVLPGCSLTPTFHSSLPVVPGPPPPCRLTAPLDFCSRRHEVSAAFHPRSQTPLSSPWDPSLIPSSQWAWVLPRLPWDRNTSVCWRS